MGPIHRFRHVQCTACVSGQLLLACSPPAAVCAVNYNEHSVTPARSVAVGGHKHGHCSQRNGEVGDARPGCAARPWRRAARSWLRCRAVLFAACSAAARCARAAAAATCHTPTPKTEPCETPIGVSKGSAGVGARRRCSALKRAIVTASCSALTNAPSGGAQPLSGHMMTCHTVVWQGNPARTFLR